MNLMQQYIPEGFAFRDTNLGPLLYIMDGPYRGWICGKSPDGCWVTLRLATIMDLEKIQALMAARN